MSEKMRDYQWQQAGWIASWMKRHAINLEAEPFAELQDHLAALRTHENGGQESEAGAVARGYALLGTGQYVIHHTLDFDAELGAELMITLASEGEKAGRTVGDLQDVPDGTMIQAKDMVIRIGFINERGLFALEQQLRLLREAHFPDSSSAPPFAPAIEYATIMKCAEVCENIAMHSSDRDGRTELVWEAVAAIKDLIPQDGRTALEELLRKEKEQFGRKVAFAVYEQHDKLREDETFDGFKEIVTNLIGVPPLNSETVSGEE